MTSRVDFDDCVGSEMNFSDKLESSWKKTFSLRNRASKKEESDLFTLEFVVTQS